MIRPTSVVELGEQIRQAEAVFPLGGRTQLDLGYPPSRDGIALDLTRLDQIIDYPARDMTITVQAGIRLAQLQRVLAGEGQRLPLDVPRAEQATLGGVLATNTSGSRRYGAGTARDYVIGISTVNDEGQETKAGGRVVKNVAGYDLCKLHLGALGTLGVISQVTLKVRPIPEASAVLMFGCETAALPTLLEELHASQTRPICLDLLNAAAVRHAGLLQPKQAWLLVIGFEDSETAVHWQMQQLIRELTRLNVVGTEAAAGAATQPVWQSLTELTAPTGAGFSLQAGVLPSQVAEFAAFAAGLPGDPLIHAHAGNGLVRVHWLQTPDASTAVAHRETLAARAGHLTVLRCPSALKPLLPLWGTPRADAELMRQVKHALDPRGRFNPGRFLQGI